MGLFSLIAKIGADVSGYERGMARVDSLTKATMGSAGRDIRAAFGGAFSVATAGYIIRQTVEHATRIKDLAEQYRMTTDQVQKLDLAAKKVGLTFEDFGSAISKGFDPFGPNAIDHLAEYGSRAYRLREALNEIQNVTPLELISADDLANIDKADKFLDKLGRHLDRKVARGLADASRLGSSNPRQWAHGLLGLTDQLGDPMTSALARSLQNALRKRFPSDFPTPPASGYDETQPIHGFPPFTRSGGNPYDFPASAGRQRFERMNVTGPNLQVDDLARIGGFTGGADQAVKSVLQQQLAVQRAIEYNQRNGDSIE